MEKRLKEETRVKQAALVRLGEGNFDVSMADEP